MKTYEAKWDKTVKIVTVIAMTVMLAGMGVLLFAAVNSELTGIKALIPWIGFLFAMLTLGAAYLIRPIRYTVGPSKIKIIRPVGEIELKKSEIHSIHVLNKKSLGLSARKFGVGGLFGYMGKFYTKPIGHYTAYVTDRNNLVLIKLKSGKKYLISPENTDWVTDWL